MKYTTITPPTATVSVPGPFIKSTWMELDAELNAAYQNGCTKVVIDLAQTAWIDSTTIKRYARIKDYVGSSNLILANPQPKVLAILKAGRLESFIRV